MSAPQATPQEYTQLALSMYLESLQQWKKTYENAVQREKNVAVATQSEISIAEPVRTTTQNLGAQFFRRMIEAQMGLCRFFEYRWSNYMALPDALFSFKSPLDVLPLQASFVKQLIEDYTDEGARMMQSYFPAAPRAALGHQR